MVSETSQNIQATLKSLSANHFDARLAQTVEEARKIMLQMIPPEASVGIGDSTTLRQIGIMDELVQRGTQIVNPFTRELTRNRAENQARHRLFIETCRRSLSTDVFLTSANALTRDGKVVSIDYAGNRAAGTIYGAPRVILPVGRNKIVINPKEAVHRIKNVIAPAHAERKGKKTPCAMTGKCTDCDSPARICNVTIILEKKPAHTDLSVILINEDLGLGWDPAWDENRISKIKSCYYQYSWVF